MIIPTSLHKVVSYLHIQFFKIKAKNVNLALLWRDFLRKFLLNSTDKNLTIWSSIGLKTIQSVQLILTIAFPVSCFTQIDSTKYKSCFLKLEEGKACYAQSAKSPQCAKLLREVYDESNQHAFFMEEILATLIKSKDYWAAREYIDIKRVDRLSNAQRARYFYFKGLLDLQAGFYRFTPAHQAFKTAYYSELRSNVPSFPLMSQIQNAIGYSRTIYGGPNLSHKDDSPHCNWMTSDLLNSLRNFNQAIYFDEENEFAVANRDTLIAKIKKAGIWVEEFEELTAAKPLEVLRSELLIKEKSTNDTLDLVDVNLLPNNKEVLLNILNKYDELLLAVDISGSMEDIHTTKDVSRFRLMKELVLFLFHELPASTQLGIVSVGGQCNRHPQLYFPTEMDARRDIMEEIKKLRPDGNTPLIYSLTRGKELYTARENKKALFLISDGMERCGPPLDLCILAGDLYAIGIDLHIISFIVAGMEDSEFAYEIYSCMTRYSNGRIFKYDEQVEEEIVVQMAPVHKEKLLLPPINVGENFKGVLHFEVDLSDYFGKGKGVILSDEEK